MLCVPTPSADVAHVAVRALPLPLNVAAEQPEIDAPPSMKLTLPPGTLPLTVAVNVTEAPCADGVSEVATAVVLPALLTVCDSAPLLEGLFVASPL
jgi:hypothetical protein